MSERIYCETPCIEHGVDIDSNDICKRHEQRIYRPPKAEGFVKCSECRKAEGTSETESGTPTPNIGEALNKAYADRQVLEVGGFKAALKKNGKIIKKLEAQLAATKTEKTT